MEKRRRPGGSPAELDAARGGVPPFSSSPPSQMKHTQMKKPPISVAFLWYNKNDFLNNKLQIGDDVAEDVADNRAKQEQNSDNNDGHQDQDQRVLNQTLTFFTR